MNEWLTGVSLFLLMTGRKKMRNLLERLEWEAQLELDTMVLLLIF